MRIGAVTCSPRATVACPAMTARSQPARTGNDGTGRQCRSYVHSPPLLADSVRA